MRRPYSEKAGATFSREVQNLTLAVRKEGIEIIYKMKPSRFFVTTLMRENEKSGILIVNCSDFLKAIEEYISEGNLPKLETNCHTLFGLLNNQDEIGMFDFKVEDKKYTGIAIPIPIPEKTPLMYCLNDEIIIKMFQLYDKMADVYRELLQLPELKHTIDELWEP